jgi:hypothetical protein
MCRRKCFRNNFMRNRARLRANETAGWGRVEWGRAKPALTAGGTCETAAEVATGCCVEVAIGVLEAHPISLPLLYRAHAGPLCTNGCLAVLTPSGTKTIICGAREERKSEGGGLRRGVS